MKRVAAWLLVAPGLIPVSLHAQQPIVCPVKGAKSAVARILSAGISHDCGLPADASHCAALRTGPCKLSL